MTPLSIEIEGIRSFTAPQTIAFGGLELFAIIGDTGSGKSSILEAMIYALFNGTSWDGKNVKELMSTGATRMKVRFRFSLGDRTYTITRSTPREGAAIHLLECDGFPDERRDGERAMSERLIELLGVDRDQFIKTVILPQGEFAALLMLKPAARAKLLTEVLGLGVIDIIAEKVDVARAGARTLWDSLKGRRSVFPDDPSTALREAAETAERKAAEECKLRVGLEELGVHASALALFEQRVEWRATIRKTLASIAPEVEALLGILDLEDELRQHIERAGSERAVAKAHLDATSAQVATAKAERLDAESVAGFQRVLVGLTAQWTELHRELTDLQDRKLEATSIESELSERITGQLSSRARAEAAAVAATAAKVDAEAASAAFQTAEKAWDVFTRAKATALEAAEEKTIATARLSEAESELARTKQSADVAEKALNAARARLDEAERENAAAHAAHGLTADDSCPICRRALPPDFQPPVAADLDSARRDVKEREVRYRGASQAHTQSGERLTFAQKAVEECAQKFFARQAALDQASAGAEAAGIDLAVEAEEALAGARRAAGSAEAKRAASAEAQSAAQREFDRAETLLEHTRERIDEINADVQRREGVVADRSRETAVLRAKIPEAYLSTTLELSAAQLAAAADRLNIAAATARGITDAHMNALQAEREASDRVQALEERRRLKIDRPIAEGRMRLLSSSERLSSLGYEMPAESESGGDLLHVLGWGNALLVAVAKAEATLAKEAAQDEDAASSANAKIAALLLCFEVTSAADLRAKREAALLALGAAASARDSSAQDVVEAAALDSRLASVEPAARALDALHTLLGGAKFRKFVTDRKQDKLLGVATSILRRMTNERYGFGLDMRIVDRSASQARAPETLSGGEKFLASLALALALVEIAKRSGRHFGALFLDEGFGSLDPQALDEALSELDRQTQSGRMIGVITHVRAVVDYIDDVLRVIRTPNGSEVLRDVGNDEIEPAVSAA